MDQLYDSGLFTELGELMAHDQVFYEDNPKQSFYSTSPLDECQQLYPELSHVEQPPLGGGDSLDSLLAEGNQLLDRFMAENGLDLLSTPVDLADVDELVNAKLTQHHERPSTLLVLDEVSSYDTYMQQAASPASSISTLPSEPSSPAVDLLSLDQELPVVSASGSNDESQQFTDLLESLLGEEEQVNYSHYDYDIVHSPASTDVSYNASSPCSDLSCDTPYSSQLLDQSWDDNCSNYSQTTYSPEPEKQPSATGKTKPKKKSKSTPYSKLPAGRKERKKQQNKEAAIRYREKKRSEAMQSQSEEQQLTDRNKELKTEVLNLEREIMCMKELLSDVFNIHSI